MRALGLLFALLALGTACSRPRRPPPSRPRDDAADDPAAGQRATLELRGGRTGGYLCHVLDVQMRVLDGERVLADDDDGAGGLGSRVTFTAPRAGRYSVRVMAHGPWGNHGDYVLRYVAE